MARHILVPAFEAESQRRAAPRRISTRIWRALVAAGKTITRSGKARLRPTAGRNHPAAVQMVSAPRRSSPPRPIALMALAWVAAAGPGRSLVRGGPQVARSANKSTSAAPVFIQGPRFRMDGWGFFDIGGTSQKSQVAVFPMSPNLVGLFRLPAFKRTGTLKLPWKTGNHHWLRRMALSSGTNIVAVSIGRKSHGRIAIFAARAASAKLLKQFDIPGVPYYLALNPSGEKVIVLWGRQVGVYAAKTGKCLLRLATHHDTVRCAFSPNGHTVAIAPIAHWFELIKWSAGSKHVVKIPTTGGVVLSMAFGPRGRRLFAAISGSGPAGIGWSRIARFSAGSGKLLRLHVLRGHCFVPDLAVSENHGPVAIAEVFSTHGHGFRLINNRAVSKWRLALFSRRTLAPLARGPIMRNFPTAIGLGVHHIVWDAGIRHVQTWRIKMPKRAVSK